MISIIPIIEEVNLLENNINNKDTNLLDFNDELKLKELKLNDQAFLFLLKYISRYTYLYWMKVEHVD